ncbi:MAG: hypothetical protein Q4C20_15475 [Erysipelotrichaceae bacterium]|nr:hypothetical protein [Erysipelotrichaceae bacterium]
MTEDALPEKKGALFSSADLWDISVTVPAFVVYMLFSAKEKQKSAILNSTLSMMKIIESKHQGRASVFMPEADQLCQSSFEQMIFISSFDPEICRKKGNHNGQQRNV